MVVGANAIRAAVTHAQLHSGAPGGSGTSNVTSAGRQAVTWAAATGNGDFALASPVTFTGVAASGAVTYVTLWTALTGGTLMGSFALAGDQAANAAGTYRLDALVLDGTAT